MNRHFGFDLKTFRQNRKTFNEQRAERAITRHNVKNFFGIFVARPKRIYAKTHERISEVVEGTFVLLKIGRAQSVADNHVGFSVKNQIAHFAGVVGGVSVVAVGHYVAVRVNFAKHRANNIPLALPIFMTNNRAGFLSDLGGVVRRVVIINVNICFG